MAIWDQFDWRHILRGYVWMFAGIFAGYLITLPIAIMFSIPDKTGMAPQDWYVVLYILLEPAYWFVVLVAFVWGAIVAMPSFRILNRSRMAAGIACVLALGVYYAVFFFPYSRGLDAWEWFTGANRTGSRTSYQLFFYLIIPMALTAVIASLVVLAGRFVRPSFRK